MAKITATNRRRIDAARCREVPLSEHDRPGAGVDGSPVRDERSGGIMRITFDRAEKMNAFDDTMHRRTRRALERAASDDAIRVVVLTGSGRAFCAGQDLGDRVAVTRGQPVDLGATVEANWNPLIRLIRTMPKPVLAAVNGVAAGAGANLALACDIVVAARSARFIQSFAKLGLIPDAGGTWCLPRLVGDARARAIVMLAEPVTAEQAADWGMIWKVVDDEALGPEIDRLAAHFAAAPTQGFALQKQAFLASATNGLDAQLDQERDLQRAAGFTPDYAEGVTAFLAKRTPVFTGRPR